MNAPSRARIAHEPSALARVVASLALQDAVQFAYLAFLLIAVYRGSGPTRVDALRWLTVDLAALSVGIVAWRGAVAPSPAALLAYRAAICVPVLASFSQLHLILPAAVDGRLVDAQLLALNQQLLHYEPAVAWDSLVRRPVTEWLSFFYISYFVLLGTHVFPMLAFERRKRLLGEFALGILSVYCIGQSLYILVPGYGPLYHLAGSFQNPLEGDFWYPLMRRIVSSGGARTDVFPSLHTAGPSFIAMFSFRHRREKPFRYTWPVVAFVASQIIVATMYLRWHYLIDVVAGLALATAVTVWSAKAVAWESASRARRALPPVW